MSAVSNWADVITLCKDCDGACKCVCNECEKPTHLNCACVCEMCSEPYGDDWFERNDCGCKILCSKCIKDHDKECPDYLAKLTEKIEMGSNTFTALRTEVSSKSKMSKCPMCEENKPNVEFKTDMGDGDVLVCEDCYNDICEDEDDGEMLDRCDICGLRAEDDEMVFPVEVEDDPYNKGPRCCMSCEDKGFVWVEGSRKSLWMHKDDDEYAEYLKETGRMDGDEDEDNEDNS